jgi:hypothetical protein
MRGTGGEVAVPSYELFNSSEILGRMAMTKMLGGLSSRRYTVGLEPVGEKVERTASATSKSAVSRRFVALTETALGELLAAPLGQLREPTSVRHRERDRIWVSPHQPDTAKVQMGWVRNRNCLHGRPRHEAAVASPWPAVSTYAEDSGGLGNNTRPGRHILRDNCVRADGRAVADSDPAKNDATSPERHSRADLRGLIQFLRRVGFLVRGEGDAMVEHTVVADDAPLVYDHAVLMVELDPPPQTRRPSDLDAQEVADIASQECMQDHGRTSQKSWKPIRTNRLTDAVDDKCLEAREVPAAGPGHSVLSHDRPQARETGSVPRGRR